MKEFNLSGTGKDLVQTKPYIVSEDIKILLEPWAVEKGYVLPGSDFFVDLREQFSSRMSQIFPSFELISEEELSAGLKEMVEESNVPPLSLDRVYYPSELRLDITRTIDSNGVGKGLSKRSDSSSLLSQFKRFKDKGFKEVAVVDDVIFSGDLLERVCALLERVGISVPSIYAGIGIEEGLEKLSNSGREVRCVRRYPEVIDEVCERDFYPGVPFSGRLISQGDNVGAPYILPFGDPGNWASIPYESEESISKFCINQTVTLFTAIEDASKRVVSCADIERKVINMPKDNTRFVDALRLYVE